MTTLSRRLTVPVALGPVAAYLSDLANSVHWDPHTVRCDRLGGAPLAMGSRYAHTRAFGGYEVTLEMAVVELEPKRHVAWQGGNEFGAGREELSFAPDGRDATAVTHTVDITLQGMARLGNPLLESVMTRIADDGTEAMRAALLQLADQPDGR